MTQNSCVFINIFFWIKLFVTVYRKTRHNAAPFEKIFFALTELSASRYWALQFYRRSLSRSHYNRPSRSLPSAWNNTFLRNRSIFSQYLRTPRCARFSCRRSHFLKNIEIIYLNFTNPSNLGMPILLKKHLIVCVCICYLSIFLKECNWKDIAINFF